MGRTNPVTQAETLRELTRQANAAIKDLRNAEKTLRAAIDEARQVGPALVAEYLADAIGERLAEFDATLAALADTAAGRAETVHTELDRLHDAAARLAPTPADSTPDDRPGAFSCPGCGAHLDAHKHMGRLTEPIGAGDGTGFTVCAYCGQVAILLTSGGVRRATAAEDTAIRRTPAFRRAETLRTALDIGPDELEKIRGLIERSSLGTPGAKALRSRVSAADAARVVAMSKQVETGRPARGGSHPDTQPAQGGSAP